MMMMKAVTYEQYGLPNVLDLKDVQKPKPKDDEVLIKVRAVSLNASDWEFLTATPAYIRMWGFRKPKFSILGSDVAGEVVDLGNKVKHLKIGDEVFGDLFSHWGGLAEFVCASEDVFLQKPAHVTFEEAAAIPQAAVVALQGLRYKRRIKPGQKVLINGAGGGTGTFAIQLAKLFGAEVTAVDHKSKLALMNSLKADHVIDYEQNDFTQTGSQYDMILDLVARHSVFEYKRALFPNGIYCMVGGAMWSIFETLVLGSLMSKFGDKKMGVLMHKQNKKDIGYILSLIEAGSIRPVIDKCYTLDATSEAFQRLGDGHAKGKVVITI